METAKVKIKIKNRVIQTDCLNITIFLSFVTLCVAQTFNVSSLIFFLIDVPIVFMVLKKTGAFVGTLLRKPVIIMTITLFIAFAAMMVGVAVNAVPVGNAIYGLYKYFRGFLFFYCTLAFCDTKSIVKTMRMIKVIFALNIAMTFFQFFLQGVNQDLLGGIFGIVVGVNQYTNMFFVVISVYCIEKILNRDANRKEYKLVLVVSGMMLIVAALAEIKYFFAEFVVLFLIAYFALPKNTKSVIAILLIALCVVGCYNVLIRNFPEFSNLVHELRIGGVARLADIQRHYSTDYDMGRAAVFSYSNRYLLHKPINRLLGMGIGNVTSSSIVNNSFWMINQETHYDQFYTAYLYNEQGIIGFALYCLIYLELLVIGVGALMNEKTRKYGTMLVMLIVGCMMIFAYNMALYSQLSFLIFWMLAVLVKKCVLSN